MSVTDTDTIGWARIYVVDLVDCVAYSRPVRQTNRRNREDMNARGFLFLGVLASFERGVDNENGLGPGLGRVTSLLGIGSWSSTS